jgi:sensor domain CHASE-containing protein
MHAPAHYSPLKASNHPRIIVAGIGGFCVLLGCLVLVGWHMHLRALIQVQPGLPPMQYNTAICFVLAGVALGIWALDKAPRGISILGGLIAAVGILTLAEYLFHANLGIDQALFRSYITTETSNAGRMSPVSAFCFAFAGVALLFLGPRGAPRWRLPVIGSVASVIISISLVAISGYAFGLPGTYGWGQLTRVAAHTAAGLGLLGAGLFIISWALGVRPGERAPRWLPVPLALGVFTGSLVLYFALDAKQNEEIAQTVKAGAEGAKNQIVARMEGRTRSLVRMERRWEFSGAPPQAAWEADAGNDVHDLPDLQAIAWIDASHRVRWVVPLAGNEAKLNLDLTQEPRRKAAVEQAEREHQPVMTRIVTLFHGGLGFVIYVPIVVNGQSEGFLAEIFNAQTCLQRYFPPAVAAGEAIQVSEGGRVFFERDAGTSPARNDWVVEQKIELHGATWDLRMWPTPEMAARLDSPLPAVDLFGDALCAMLLGAVCFYAQRSSRQATETARANTALQAAIDKVKTLEGLLPICSYCKRVRDDTGYWSQIDTYLHDHTNASLSHGYCPECAAKAFKDFGFDVPQEVQAELEAHNFE